MNAVGVWREVDGFEEEQETLCAGDRVQGGPTELRGDSESQLVLTSLEFTLLSISSVALGTSLSWFGLHFLHL